MGYQYYLVNLNKKTAQMLAVCFGNRNTDIATVMNLTAGDKGSAIIVSI